MDVCKIAERWGIDNDLDDDEIDVAASFGMVLLSRMRCERCKHGHKSREYKFNRLLCQHPNVHEALACNDYGDYVVGEDFGCIHFEERE
jgi:hypothetical protein